MGVLGITTKCVCGKDEVGKRGREVGKRDILGKYKICARRGNVVKTICANISWMKILKYALRSVNN